MTAQRSEQLGTKGYLDAFPSQAPHDLGATGALFSCPICDGATRRLFRKHGYWIRSCDVCRHQWVEITPSPGHIKAVYNDLYFQGDGAGYPDYLSEGQILQNRGRWYSRLLARYMAPGTLLDIGTAAGFVLRGFLDEGWNGKGIEPNARMAEFARTRLGLPVDTGTLEEFQTGDRYDVISMIQVVAHFVHPRRAFRAAAEVTRPAGFWLIETWNRESLTARILGKHWHEYSPPSVLHWFSAQGLGGLAAQFGFREIARGRPMKWISGAHAKSLLQYNFQDSRLARLAAATVRVIPDGLAIPYPAEDLFWALFQKL